MRSGEKMASLMDEICETVAVQLGCRGVSPADRLIEELGAESADVLNIAAALEDRYGIRIAEEELGDVSCIEDLHRLVAARRS
jgi:acyl carrier protein